MPDQTASLRKVRITNRSKPMLGGQSGNRFAAGIKQRIVMNQDCINASPLDRRKRALKCTRVAGLDGFNLHPISLGFTARRCKYLHENWVGWIDEDTHLGDARFSLFE